MQRPCIVADNVKAATLGWPLWAKGAHDYMASGFGRASDLADVSDAIAGGGKEMKHGAVVVPHIVGGWLQLGFA